MDEIEILNGLKTVVSKCLTVKECKERNSAIDKAIQALQENVALKARLNRALKLVELAVNDIPHICETCRVENKVNPDCMCNQNLNPNTYIHTAWEWQHQYKFKEFEEFNNNK